MLRFIAHGSVQSYQKMMFSTTQTASRTKPQSTGLFNSGKWAAEGISVSPKTRFFSSEAGLGRVTKLTPTVTTSVTEEGPHGHPDVRRNVLGIRRERDVLHMLLVEVLDVERAGKAEDPSPGVQCTKTNMPMQTRIPVNSPRKAAAGVVAFPEHSQDDGHEQRDDEHDEQQLGEAP